MKDATRRQMVNILVAHMIDSHGHLPPKAVREEFVMLFPSLKYPYADKGYIIVNIYLYNTKLLTDSSSGGPNLQRTVNVIHQLDGDACKEVMSLLNHTTDNSVILQKMKETFQHRQRLVSDPGRSVGILSTFPRFLDPKGPVEQDFTLLLDDDRLLQKWKTFFRPKKLTSTPELLHFSQQKVVQKIIKMILQVTFEQEMASLLVLLHLLPPPGGQRSPKISASDASQRLLVFHKFPYVNPNHAAVWKSISAINKVDNQTSSLSGIRRARLTPSTSPWMSISFHARRATHSGHLMNCSKHILCLILIYFWLKMTFFYGKQVVCSVLITIYMHSELYIRRRDAQ
ncbi:hypothetical protein ACER0C_002762 [Sarotherodon galilaeus]